MKRGKGNQKISLSRKIFQYLLGVTAFSLIVIGFFWVDGKLNDYKKEITALKKTFSETKKSEIKYKILQIKDYIYWIRNNPVVPLSRIMEQEVNKLNIKTFEKDLLKKKVSEKLKDSIGHSRVPVYLIDKSGKIYYSFSPFHPAENKVDEDKTKILHQLKKSQTTQKNIFPLYKLNDSKDSVLKAFIYFNYDLLPGFTAASIVSGKDIEKVLQLYILDSLSKLRYAKDEYIFINSYEGKALVSNGKLNIPPVDIFLSGDSRWINVFKIEQSAAYQMGGVFYTYSWQKISSKKNDTKTSYFSYLPAWEWIIGTGFYEDDVNSIIDSKSHALFNELQKKLLSIVALFLFSAFLSYLIVVFFAKRLKKNIILFNNFFEKTANENVLIDKTKVNYKEFENIAEAANLMVEEREKVKAALSKSEEKFLKAFKNSPDAIVITSINDGYIFDANESTSRITGYSSDEIIGQTITDLKFWIHVEERNRYVSIIKKFGRVENFEADVRMKSGEVRNGLFSGEIIEIDKEKYILSVIRDITERKKIEKELLNSEERYRFLFEQNPVSMLIYDNHNLQMLAVNESFEKQYGYSSKEALSMLLPDLYPPEEKAPIAELVKNIHGHTYAGEWHHIKKDGSVIPIIATSNDLVYMGREARIAVVTDITEIKQAEEELLKKNKNLLFAQKIARLGFLDWDLTTNEIIPSEEIYNIYGLPSGRKFETPEFVAMVSYPDDVPYIQENLGMALQGIKPYNIDHRIIRPTGEILWVNAQAELIRDPSGKPVRLLGIVMDITGRKAAEEEIQKLNQSLEERVAERTAQLININKELESFSYSISHDLRAPLRAIFGFSQILVNRHRESLNDEGRQYMDYIVEASVRMEQLINDLLNYSRLGRKSLNIRTVSLTGIINNIYDDFQHKLEEIGANFIVDPGLPQIQGDESLLRQTFTNLIDNAITYRRPEVPLEINIAYESTAKDHLLKISDNGIGIPQEYWEKIFNIFQRLHSEDKYPGTGIGLATVRKAISMLDGTVWVESTEGKGSTFYINLPKQINLTQNG